MKLQELESRSYIPYSGQPAAVVVESQTGKLYPGVRIENISFPLTIPAVQCGLVTCLSEGQQPETVYLSSNLSSKSHWDFWKNELTLQSSEAHEIDGEPTKILQPTDDINSLLTNLLNRSHSPYSNFPVSALLVTKHGAVSGVNIEFSAWESGLCAERVALAKAIAYGINLSSIKALHLHAQYGEYSSPCGACRQVIIEHLPRIPVFIHHPDESVSRHFSSDLLPYSFKSDFLEQNKQQVQNQ